MSLFVFNSLTLMQEKFRKKKYERANKRLIRKKQVLVWNLFGIILEL